MKSVVKKKIYQLDAFTSEPYAGNPAGVVPDAKGLSEEQMLKIAKEMNLSETAFVFPGGEGYDVEVRFFTPTGEVNLCGHATIATFTLLKNLDVIPRDRKNLVQKTRVGNLDIKLEGNHVIMRQAEPKRIDKPFSDLELCRVMNIKLSQLGTEKEVAMIDLKPEIWSTGLEDIILPIKTVKILKSMGPNMDALSGFSKSLDIIGVHAFTFDDNGGIWCRNFAPACGIPEESATGTSNGALGAYLVSKGINEGRNLAFTANQGDWMGRPSRILVEISKTSSTEVWVGGEAVIVLEGEILVN